MHGLSRALACFAALALAGCGQHVAADDAPSTAPPLLQLKPAAEALAGAHVPTLDPATMNGAEIRKVVGERARCTFRYTSSGKPVLVAGLGTGGSPEVGVVKLNGSLVALQPDAAATGLPPGSFALAADRVRLRVQPDRPVAASTGPDGRVDAELVFEVGQELKVGYGGYLECKAGQPAPAAAS